MRLSGCCPQAQPFPIDTLEHSLAEQMPKSLMCSCPHSNRVRMIVDALDCTCAIRFIQCLRTPTICNRNLRTPLSQRSTPHREHEELPGLQPVQLTSKGSQYGKNVAPNKAPKAYNKLLFRRNVVFIESPASKRRPSTLEATTTEGSA